MKTVTVLGSTGSVGSTTLRLLESAEDSFEVVALTGGANWRLLAEQARKFKPGFVAIADERHFEALRDALKELPIEVAAGASALLDAASRPAEWVMAGIVGVAGLAPTIEAVRRGVTVAFANKECLVSAGTVMLDEVAKAGATLLPADSEHNAIFQVFEERNREQIERIILTASGGPFRDLSLAEMARKTPAQALAHPNWDMGKKISIDSATMMNKGLEIIEAHHLFAMPDDRIDVLVHPQSIVHSLVAYGDGSVLAQLGTPDMATPIANVLAWPERMPVAGRALNLAEISNLTFEKPDPERFPALRLARDALRAGGAAPLIMNAANEIAVAEFLSGRIGFLDIAKVVEKMLEKENVPAPRTIVEVLEFDAETREATQALVNGSSFVRHAKRQDEIAFAAASL
jgi:1-deoxy-D-xylulose-5-phosphate reductoisomerase